MPHDVTFATDKSQRGPMPSPTGVAALDCSRPGPAAFWFGLGVGLGLLVMFGASRGDLTWLLHVGALNPGLHKFEKELGPVKTPDDRGHDGQIYYLIARDPFATHDSPQAIANYDDVGPKYRYRRILFPLLAGGFGLFDGRATLHGMVALAALAMGLVMVAIADIAFQLRLKGAVVIVAGMHPGVVAPLQLLTADTLALGLALAGIALTLRTRIGWATVVFALAALTKEIYVLAPLAAAPWVWMRAGLRSALILMAVPVVATAGWAAWITPRLPGLETPVAIFDIPFVGITQAFLIWIKYERDELILAGFAILMMLLAASMLLRGRNALLRLMMAPWFAVGCCSGIRIWGKPNNAIRAFAILWPLSVLLFAQWRSPGARKGSSRLSAQ
jgi:hypothetical protein